MGPTGPDSVSVSASGIPFNLDRPGRATTGEVWAMCQILHDWPDAECRAILSRCRERMRENDRLLILEMLTVPANRIPASPSWT
jgi:hypothetical protein